MKSAREQITGQVIEDTVVPACKPWSAEVRKGDILRIVDLEGQQTDDFLCYDLMDRTDRYDEGRSVKFGIGGFGPAI